MRNVGRWVLLATLLMAGAVFACGDKLMLLAGGVRFWQVHAGARPASILAYTPQNSPVSGVVRELERQRSLQKAGHTFVAVQDFTRLDEALKDGKYDLVLVGLADADGLVQEIRSATSKPGLLPVLYRPTKAEATAAEKKFHCVLKAPASPSSYLSAIDEVMEARLKSKSPKILGR